MLGTHLFGHIQTWARVGWRAGPEAGNQDALVAVGVMGMGNEVSRPRAALRLASYFGLASLCAMPIQPLPAASYIQSRLHT